MILAKIIAKDIEHIKLFKERIIALLLSQFRMGLIEADLLSLYPGVEPRILKAAIQELIREGKVEVI